MAIFNLNTGQFTEATSYPLDDTNISLILDNLKDNEDRLVSPKDIRDSILSLWSGIPFKETFTGTGSSYSYIAVDSSNPSDKDIKRRIFIGKRAFSGTYSYIPSHDIMNEDLLIGASSSDIFLFNTKSDQVINTTTKIMILSGKNSQSYNRSPYIQSQYVSNTSSLSLDFVSTGDLRIASNYADSSINSVLFPKIVENIASASNNSTFFYNNGRIVWDQIKFPNTSLLGTSSETINIVGSEVNVNGYSLELKTTYVTPKRLGGVEQGTSFNNVSIVDVLKRVIYTYLPPIVTIGIDNNYAEIGTIPSPIINFKIYKKTNNTQVASLINMIPGTYPAISSNEHLLREGTASGIIFSPPLTSSETTFSISVNDGVSNATASTFIKGIYPYFYGFTSSVINQSDLRTMSKLVEYLGDKSLFIEVDQNMIDNGYNWFHFIYDSSYPDIYEIVDENNNIISFTSSVRTFISPNGLWTTKSFKTYKFEINTVIYPTLKFEFKY